MLEAERLRALAEQVRMQLIQRCIDRGIDERTGMRVIILDYNLKDFDEHAKVVDDIIETKSHWTWPSKG